MDDRFKIQFRIPIDYTERTIILDAWVTLHHSSPHYKITSINVPGSPEDKGILLPDIDIKCIHRDDALTWVHVDSGKSSTLSIAAGQAIAQALNSSVEVAEENVDDNDDN
jgi:hypothetical protein